MAKEIQLVIKWLIKICNKIGSITNLLRVFILTLLLINILNVQQSLAEGYYELVEGKGVEVCEAYEKNLNSFKPKVPMVCGRKVNKEIEGFGKPHWTRPEAEITPSGKALYDFYLMFGDLLWERDANPVYYYLVTKWPEWQGTPEQLKEARQKYDIDREARSGLKPVLSEFDIDNDGKVEPVYFEQPCGSVYGSLLAVLTPDYKGFDRVKTALVMPHHPFDQKGRGVFRALFPGERSNSFDEKYGYRPIEDSVHKVHYDVFFYKNKTYFDQWWRANEDFKGKSDIEAGRLRVYQARPKGTVQLCSYRFNLKK